MLKILLLTALAFTGSQALGVPFCTPNFVANIPFFTYTVNGSQDNSTQAYVCHDDQTLEVRWRCTDSQVISNFGSCNDPLYQEDVVQIFIASTSVYPRRYYELEVSPRGVLFFADITNPNGNCTGLQTTYLPCSSAQYSARTTPFGWEATLRLSLVTVGRGVAAKQFKANIFRIDKSSTAPTRYLSYIPTLTSPACFHQPARFIDFDIVYEQSDE